MHDDEARNYQPRRPGRLFTAGWIATVALIVIVTAAFVLAHELRIQRDTEQREHALAQGRRVLVIRPNRLPPTRTIDVPATVRSYVVTAIYAKIPGYLRTITVDKGDLVKEGQLLAVLDSPEIDQQVSNARATFDLQVATNQRNQNLFREGIVARQSADESRSAMLQAKATLDQLVAMQGYKELRAPYAGIVSARNYDPGTLIPQATQSTGTPILTMGTITPMRVYADVPQSITPNIHLGDPATLTVREYPGRAFTGTVARRAEALQTATRTMLIEVDVDNADGVLYHGMYGRLSFAVALHGDTPQLPDDALIFRGGKVYVPVVRDNHLNLVEVALGYDDGRTVEVTSGIAPDDLVAINVGQAVRDGDVVQAVPAEQR